MLGVGREDPALLALAGEVYLRNGQPAEAAKYFTKTVALDPKNSGGRLGLAVSHLATGETDIAFQELESAAAESSGEQADLILIRLGAGPGRVRQSACCHRRVGKEAAEHAACPPPERDGPPRQTRHCGCPQELRAGPGARRGLLPGCGQSGAPGSGGQEAGGREEALRRRAGQGPEECDRAAWRSPNFAPGMGGSPDEVAALIEKAIAANPTAVLPRTRSDLATDCAPMMPRRPWRQVRMRLAALPDQPEDPSGAGRAQLASGDTNQALASYNKTDPVAAEFTVSAGAHG